MMRIGINGMGRIGRILFKMLSEKSEYEVVAINDLMNADNLLYLLKYDSISGPWGNSPEISDKQLVLGTRKTRILNNADPAQLPWKELNVDLVIECTGRFTTYALAEKHLLAGAKKVLLSTTGSENIPLIIRGVNEGSLKKEQPILSIGGCMTNCTAILLGALIKQHAVDSVQINVLHSYTSRQSLVDGPHKDIRRGRASGVSIIPVEIDLAETLERLLPEIKGKVAATSTRVPVSNGALAHLYITLHDDVNVAQINSLYRVASEQVLKGILQYNTDPIVSADITGNSHSAIFDATLTSVVNHQLRIGAWFDNEFGYSTRLLETIETLNKF
ncbi:MAG: type I glyceraldehyde-3-phosphate dehydrogenase [Bacteroidota bacterium]